MEGDLEQIRDLVEVKTKFACAINDKRTGFIFLSKHLDCNTHFDMTESEVRDCKDVHELEKAADARRIETILADGAR